MDWTWKIVYDGSTELTGEWSLPPWTPADEGIGGSDESAAGIPEAFLIRWDYVTALRLPFFETQLQEVAAWFRWAQTSAQAFTFWFDKDDDESSYDVYLVSPKLGESGFAPARDPFIDLFWLEIKIRRADGEPFLEDWSTFTSRIES